MKSTALTAMLLLIIASTAHAQFSLLPQIGFDRAHTNIVQNDYNQFTAFNAKTNFKVSVRVDYRLKGGHGPYLGIGTAPVSVQLEFTDPASAWKTAKSSVGSIPWKLEAGYQYSFKPLKIGQGHVNKKPTVQVSKKSCGAYQYKSSCGSKKPAPQRSKQATTLSIQPSMGLAYIPSIQDNIIKNNNQYKYTADHSGFAMVPALGFEFGKGKTRIMTVSLQYAKSIGAGDKGVIQTENNGKPAINSFRSATSSWSLSVGIPFNLSKDDKQSGNQQTQKRSCSEKVYKMRCVKKI